MREQVSLWSERACACSASVCCASTYFHVWRDAAILDAPEANCSLLRRFTLRHEAGQRLQRIEQIGDAAGLPVIHTVKLLDWAWGGERPAGLPEGRAKKDLLDAG